MAKISVVMTVKNGLPYIRETIESVLAQNFTDFEFLILDDGSTDGTPSEVEKAKDPRIIFWKQENTGVAKAKNRAIAKSTGKYIAIIDADDIWMPHKLQKQFDFLESNPEYVAVAGYAAIIDKDGNYIYTEKKPVTDNEIRKHQEMRNPWTHSAVFYTREAFDKIGGYYEPIKHYIVDYMLMYQLSKVGKVFQLPEVVVKYRIVPTALSAKQNSKAYNEIMHRSVKSGSVSPNDLEAMNRLKSGEDRAPAFKQSMYHLYIGRSYLFHNYNRKKSIKHLREAIGLNPELRIAKIYLAMAILLPKFAIAALYSSLSPIAGSTEVDERFL